MLCRGLADPFSTWPSCSVRSLFSKLSPLNPSPVDFALAHSDPPRVTLSATQGRQSEHDAKPGRKSRVASGSPKESEDLGMETIKGKPELVRNTRPALLLQPHSPDPSGNQVGGKWASQTPGCRAARSQAGPAAHGQAGGAECTAVVELGVQQCARRHRPNRPGRPAACIACVCA